MNYFYFIYLLLKRTKKLEITWSYSKAASKVSEILMYLINSKSNLHLKCCFYARDVSSNALIIISISMLIPTRIQCAKYKELKNYTIIIVAWEKLI